MEFKKFDVSYNLATNRRKGDKIAKYDLLDPFPTPLRVGDVQFVLDLNFLEGRLTLQEKRERG
jgi:hypothetical protein